MDETSKITMPKKACMITLMFPVKDDEEGMAIKKVLDDAIKDIPEKRYTFQITET
jgi:hypothetical protein